jgi:Bacteriocin-protection, YdeI or OmpD-Associated
MRLLLLTGGEVTLMAVLLVGHFRLLPPGEPRLAVLLQRVLVLFLPTSEVRADWCWVLLGSGVSFQSLYMFLRLRRTLPYSQQRWFVDSAEAAKKPETRTRRIDAAVERLRQSRGQR